MSMAKVNTNDKNERNARITMVKLVEDSVIRGKYLYKSFSQLSTKIDYKIEC